MNAAPFEHSQITAAAISSGVPIRPTGSSAMTLAQTLGCAAGEATHHRRIDVTGTYIRQPNAYYSPNAASPPG